MDRSVRDTAAYVFGAFRLDARRRELTRAGSPIALTPTVFDTLLFLVEHPGRVISKDELMEAIWPRRVVSEANISQTIFSLRKALEDGAGGQRLIVTAPGQGYRFTGAVQVESPPPGGAPLDVVPARPPLARPIAGGRIPAPWVLAGGVAALVAIAAALAIFQPWRPVQQRSLVVLADFQNRTGDPIFDRTLAKALEIDLVQSPFVSVLSERQTQNTLALMARSPNEPLTAALAEEVCQRNEGQAVLEGEIAALGPRYLITLTATDCAGTTTLAAEKTEASSREGVIAALDGLAARARQTLGESAGSIRRFDVPLAKEKTASLEALKAYSEGVYMFNHGKRLESVPLFQHALDIDPKFAMAWNDLGRVYGNLRETTLAKDAIKQAYGLRDTVGEREQFLITANYSELVARDLNATLRNLRLWSETYPRDGAPFANLANAENWMGHYPEAIEAGRMSLALRPTIEVSYVVLARALMHAGRLDEAATTCNQAVAKGLAGDDTHGLLEEIAFAKGDVAGANRELAWSRGKPAELRLTTLEAEYAYRLGQAGRGDALFAHVAELASEQGMPDDNPPPTARELYDMGLAADALRELAKAPADTDTNDFRFDLAEFGDPARARALLAADIKDAPTDTLLNAVSASEIRAALDLRQGHAATAVADLEPALPYEAKNYDVPYLRGVAFLRVPDGAHAAAEFRKILDHPGLEPTSPLYPLARLGLARALRLTGDTAGAKREYQTLLTAWKAADNNLPPLLAAKAEFAALH